MRGQNFLDWEGVGSISHKHFFCNISVFPVPLLSETVASWAFFEWSFWGTVLENINKKRLFPSNGVWKKNTPDSQKQKPLMVWLHMYIYIYIREADRYDIYTYYTFRLIWICLLQRNQKLQQIAHLFGMFCQESSSKTQARAQGGDDLDKLWTSVDDDDVFRYQKKKSPWKTNMSPENRLLECISY